MQETEEEKPLKAMSDPGQDPRQGQKKEQW